MKISTAELKKFKSNSAFIKSHSIIPILDFIKFDNGKATKTNLHSFIVQDIDFKGSMLVDETILFNFLNYTSEPTIDITLKDGRVFISDGVSKVSSPSDDIANFSAVPEPTEERYELSNEVFCAIKFAANFCDHMELPDMRGHVFIGNKMVGGCNGVIGYIEKFKDDLPEIVLFKETAAVVGKFNSATFSQNEKHVFFDMDNTRIGFIKPMYPFVNLSHLSNIDKKANSFEVDKSEILSFTEMCVSSTKAKGLMANMEMKDDKLKLSMSDADFSVDVCKDVQVAGTMEGSFAFNPQMMSTLLKNLPDEALTFYQSKGAYLITGETGFVSIIQQMQLINQSK